MPDSNPTTSDPQASPSDREDTLLRRVESLERTTRSLGVALVVALVLVGVTYVLSNHTDRDSIRTQELVIVDPDGNAVGSLQHVRQVTPARDHAQLTLQHPDGGGVTLGPSFLWMSGSVDDPTPLRVSIGREGIRIVGDEDDASVGVAVTPRGLRELDIIRVSQRGESVADATDAPLEPSIH